MRILVVEDELLLALDVEDAIGEAGHECVGTAHDRPSALDMADRAEVAFVDLNLSDGATGEGVGAEFAASRGMTVVYMTSDADALATGVDGALGVLPKPVSPPEVRQLIDYIAAGPDSGCCAPPPRLRIFHHPELASARQAVARSA